MIHRALAGSMERFFGILIEHFAGAFPLGWRPCRPSSRRSPSTRSSTRAPSPSGLQGMGFRVEVDESNEKLGYKIRHWKTQKVPYILV